MDELIPIQLADIGGEQIQTCNARELHKFLGVGRDFSNWIKFQIDRAGFVEDSDFVKITEKSSSPFLASTAQGRIEYSSPVSAKAALIGPQ